MRNLKVAVTGASGYLGRMVIARLESEPAVQSILGLDVRPPAYTGKKLEFRAADVRTADFVRDFQGLDAVYHLAFVVAERHDKNETRQVNIAGTRNVFEAAITAGVSKVIYSSSTTAYGAHPDNPLGFDESQPLRPNTDSYYSSDKVAVEQFAVEFFRAHPGVQFTVLRAALAAP